MDRRVAALLAMADLCRPCRSTSSCNPKRHIGGMRTHHLYIKKRPSQAVFPLWS